MPIFVTEGHNLPGPATADLTDLTHTALETDMTPDTTSQPLSAAVTASDTLTLDIPARWARAARRGSLRFLNPVDARRFLGWLRDLILDVGHGQAPRLVRVVALPPRPCGEHDGVEYGAGACVCARVTFEFRRPD